MSEKFQQFKPAPQERPDDSKKNEARPAPLEAARTHGVPPPLMGTTRRDFLKKAGKLLGGAAVAGSVFESLSKAPAGAGINKKLGMENRDQREDELTDMETIKAELAGLKKQFPNTWRTEADARANAGIELLIVALNNERGAGRTKTTTAVGIGAGLVVGFIQELARSDVGTGKVTKKEVEDKIVDVFNRLALAAAIGGGLGMGSGKLAERINSKSPDKRDLAFKEIAEKLSSTTLRRIGADGKVPEEEFKGLGEFIEKELVGNERFMIDKARLRSHIAKWGAGSFFTARELWDKSPAFRELIGREKR